MNRSPPGSSVHETFQARILEWLVISFSMGSSWLRDWTHISCIGRWILYPWATREAQCVVYRLSKIVSKDYKFTSSLLIRLFLSLRFSFFFKLYWWTFMCPQPLTPWTVTQQALLPMGFSLQEYWSKFPFPSPGELSNPGIEPTSPAVQTAS